MIISSNVRSFTTKFFANVSVIVVCSFFAATGIVSAQTSQVNNNEASESFVSASELVQHEIAFTPARVDVVAIKKSIEYPETALKSRETGRFDLIVYVGNNGEVSTVNFVTERPESNNMNAIIAAACSAVQKAHFTPAMLNNKAISSTVRIPFNFVM